MPKQTGGRQSLHTLTIATGKLEGIPLSEPHRSATSGAEPLSSSAQEASAVNGSPPCQLECAILVVDDRRAIRFLSQRILSKAGARVSEAEDGLVALEKVRVAVAAGDAPDLILLDMHMPNLDGYETARQLREFGYAGAIIALTADAMQGDMSRCLKAGCNDYLSKPIDSQRLLALVAQFCKRAAAKAD